MAGNDICWQAWLRHASLSPCARSPARCLCWLYCLTMIISHLCSLFACSFDSCMTHLHGSVNQLGMVGKPVGSEVPKLVYDHQVALITSRERSQASSLAFRLYAITTPGSDARQQVSWTGQDIRPPSIMAGKCNDLRHCQRFCLILMALILRQS